MNHLLEIKEKLGQELSLGITNKIWLQVPTDISQEQHVWKLSFWALRDGLTLGKQANIRSLEIELHAIATTVISLISNSMTPNLYLNPLVSDCRTLLNELPQKTLKHIFIEVLMPLLGEAAIFPTLLFRMSLIMFILWSILVAPDILIPILAAEANGFGFFPSLNLFIYSYSSCQAINKSLYLFIHWIYSYSVALWTSRGFSQISLFCFPTSRSS